MSTESSQLWEQFRRGDSSAFEQIYFQHVNRLYDYGVRITTDTALVEDCIQDLFSHLWEKREQLKSVVSLRSYLLVSIRRRIIRKLSQGSRTSLHSYEEQPLHSPAFSPDIPREVSDETLLFLTEAFSKLSDKQKEVLYLRFYNQLSYEEIAEVMSVQVKAVYKLTARAIHGLRSHIKIPLTSAVFVAVFARHQLFFYN